MVRVLPWLVLAVLVLPIAWLLAAASGAKAFQRHLGQEEVPVRYATCADDVSSDLNSFESSVATFEAADGLQPVAEAAQRFFSQPRWSYTRSRPGSPSVRTSQDDGIYELRNDDRGFQGLSSSHGAVVRYDRARFWVAACLRPVEEDAGLLGLDKARCARSEHGGGTVSVTWAFATGDPCGSKSGIRAWATIEDGRLSTWGHTIFSARYPDGVRTTYRAAAKQDLTWPARLHIVPRWISDRLKPG